MDITYNLFDAMRTFDNLRRANRQEYLNYKKSHEVYKGSAGYDSDMAAAAEKRKNADDAARKVAAEKVNECLRQMQENIGKIPAPAITADMVNILQVLNMKTTMTREQLDMAARSMNGNGLCLSALNDIADKHFPKTGINTPGNVPLDSRFHENYVAKYATGYTAEMAAASLNEVAAGCKDTLQYAVNPGVLRGAEIHARKYGGEVDIDSLPQRGELVSERAFFGQYVPENVYAKFMQAVNGKLEGQA